MTVVQGYDIIELPQDRRILRGFRCHQPLSYAAKAALWIGYLYLTVRFLSIAFAPSWPWQVWVMFLVENVFLRELSYGHTWAETNS